MSKKILNGIDVTGSATLRTVADAGVDTDKFLVLNASGVVSYRTGAELRTDIGADNVSKVQHEVKLGENMSIGTPVYVGVDLNSGTNMTVYKASNALESKSSKTMGLIASGGVTNDLVQVVTEGLLTGINTSTATKGDPVWLGVDGALLFGLSNKPVAPAHMVFLGVVTRVQSQNGEIFVKVQNGFEMGEFHNYAEGSVQNNEVIVYESSTSLYKPKSIPTILGYTPVPNTRTLTINGTAYDLSADRAWTITTDASARSILRFVATAGQTTFTISGGYTPGLVDAYLNGVKLDNTTDFTATNGTSIVLTNAAAVNDVLEVYRYQTAFLANNALRVVTEFTATAGQTVFNVTYNSGLVDVFYNGSKLVSTEFTASNGTSITLNFACNLNDIVEVHAYSYQVGAFTGQAQLNGTGFVKVSGTTVTYDNSTYLTTSSAASTYVPYTGATTDVNLGIYNLNSGGITVTYGGKNTNYYSSGVYSYGGSLNLYSATAGIDFFANNVTQMRLNTSGNFSIGNTNDTYRLDVSGTGRFTGALTGTSATFSSSVTANTLNISNAFTDTINISQTSGSTTKGHLGQFADSFYISNNYFYNGAQSYDDNTKLSSSIEMGAGFIYLKTGAANTVPSTKLTISSTGAATFSSSVGIVGAAGTNGTKLFVQGSASSLFDAAGTRGISFYPSQSSIHLITSDYIGTSYYPLALSARGTASDFYLSTSGNIGMGTASPQDKLHVAGAIFTTSNTVLGTTTGAIFDYNDGQDSGRLLAYKSTGSNLLFYTNPNGGGLTERMRITTSGGRQYKQQNWYGKSETYWFNSSFDNPTVTILTINSTQTYYTIMIKVTVIQNGVSGATTNYSIWSKGFAQYTVKADGGIVSYAGSMSAEAQINAGNLGTLSWSGANLQYTASRVTNYDSYQVIVEYGSNFNVNASPTLYS